MTEQNVQFCFVFGIDATPMRFPLIQAAKALHYKGERDRAILVGLRRKTAQ
jgi:hypothetical protein